MTIPRVEEYEIFIESVTPGKRALYPGDTQVSWGVKRIWDSEEPTSNGRTRCVLYLVDAYESLTDTVEVLQDQLDEARREARQLRAELAAAKAKGG